MIVARKGTIERTLQRLSKGRLAVPAPPIFPAAGADEIRGFVTVTWSGSAFSSVVEVKHGLGVAPTSIVLGAEKYGALFITANYLEVDETKFKIACVANAAAGAGTSDVGFIATV